MASRNNSNTPQGRGYNIYEMRDALSHKLLNLTHHPVELVDEIGMVAMLAKRGDQRPVIPKRPILFPGKPPEHFQTISSKGSQDRSRVMQFIGRRH